jgi:prepilin-type N-terminal cleavage/methylation domain-containing protein
MKRTAGFTLAELLIALAILGVIATFTIPKVLQSQQDSKFNSIAKEAVATISSAYDAYKLANGPSTSMRAASLAPYFNYVKKLPNGTVMDGPPTGAATYTCNSGAGLYDYRCYLMHNGAVLITDIDDVCFGGSTNTYIIGFVLDPDGKNTGKQDSIVFWLSYTGKITSWQNMTPNSLFKNANCTTDFTLNPSATGDPNWFSW